MSADPVRILARLEPLSPEIIRAEAAAWNTVTSALHSCGGKLAALPGLPCGLAWAELDGEPLPREAWDTTVVIPGQLLACGVLAGGGIFGGGGGGGITRLLGTLALVGAAIATGGWAASASFPAIAASSGWATAAAVTPWIGGLASGAVLIGGSILLNSIVPANQAQKLSGPTAAGGLSGLDRISPALTITGSANRDARYQPIPVVMGTHKVYPLKLPAWTEVVGDTEYLRELFIFGYGPLSLASLKIGETDVDDFSDVEYVIHEGYADDPALSLYTTSVRQDSLSILLSYDGGWSTRTTRGTDSTEVNFDLYFGQGLYHITSGGSFEERAVEIQAQYRKVGDETWTDFPDAAFTEDSPATKVLRIEATERGSFKRNFRASGLAAGQYELRWQRVTEEEDDGYTFDACTVSAMRSLSPASPIRRDDIPPLCMVEMRIKATDELNGPIDQFNAVATSKIPVWTGAAWEEQETGVLAWHYVNWLRGDQNPSPVEDAEIDLAAFVDWASNAGGKIVSAVVDYSTTTRQVLTDLAELGRAVPNWEAGLYSIAQDKAQDAATVPLITPRNSGGLSWRLTYPRRPHAIRARFVNAEADYQQDEMVVYWDGYSAENAIRFETWDIWGFTDPNEVWRHVRWRLADVYLRCGEYGTSQDAEHMLCSLMQRVEVQHWSLLAGLGSALIRSVTLNEGGEATACTLEMPVVMEAGHTYAATYRKLDGSLITTGLVTAAGSSTTVTFSPAVSAANKPAVGDLLSWGEGTTATVPMQVKSKSMGPDNSAQIVLGDYAPGVYLADQGTVPTHVTNISRPPANRPVAPARPVLGAIVSDESAMVRLPSGALQARILISFTQPSGQARVTAYRVQWREVGAETWRSMVLSADARAFSLGDVEQGATYELRLAAEATGVLSLWAETTHTVVGKSTPPPDVPGLLVDGRTLRWSYPSPPLDFAGFKVAYNMGQNVNRAAATLLHLGVWTDTEFRLPDGLAGTFTILVWAVDDSGNPSTGTARAVLGLGDVIPENVLETIELLSAPLIADETSVAWTNDNSQAWTGDNNAAWAQLYEALSEVFDVYVPPTLAFCRAWLDFELAGEGLLIEYRTESTAPYWTADVDPAWTADADSAWNDAPDWMPWPGLLESVKPMLHQFRISALAGEVQAEFDTCDLVFDVEDQVEQIDDVTISTAGTRLTLTKTFDVVKNIQITRRDNGLGATDVLVKDKDATLGPLIQAVTANALIDATVVGYHRRTE